MKQCGGSRSPYVVTPSPAPPFMVSFPMPPPDQAEALPLPPFPAQLYPKFTLSDRAVALPLLPLTPLQYLKYGTVSKGSYVTFTRPDIVPTGNFCFLLILFVQYIHKTIFTWYVLSLIPTHKWWHGSTMLCSKDLDTSQWEKRTYQYYLRITYKFTKNIYQFSFTYYLSKFKVSFTFWTLY